MNKLCQDSRDLTPVHPIRLKYYRCINLLCALCCVCEPNPL